MSDLNAQPALLTKPVTLWILFALTLIIAASFVVVSRIWDLTLIDAISSPDEVRAVLSGMTAEQKTAHAWTTATLDVAFPLVYGGLFAGTAFRFFPRFGRYLAVPAILVIPVDLIEGVVQVLALTETTDWIALKAYITPLKMYLFYAAVIVTLVGCAGWLYHRVSPVQQP